MSIEARVDEYVEIGSRWIAQYGLLAVGLGIFAETFLLLGLVIPGFGMLITAGLMCAQGDLSIPATLASAMAGGMLGDGLAYGMGRLWGDRLLHRYSKLDHLARALNPQSGFILLWFHFVSPMRMVVPCLAGSIGFPPLRWLLFNTLGLAAWVAFAFSIGYLTMGPLKRFGDLGYYVIFGAIFAMLIYTIWKVVQVLRRRDTPEEALDREAVSSEHYEEQLEELGERVEDIAERITHPHPPQPPR